MNLNPEAFAKEPPDYDPAIAPMSKRDEYEAALASGREPIVPSGDFWHWLGETYPAPKQSGVGNGAPPAAKSPSPGNHGWDDIVERMNAETRKAHGAGDKPAADNHGWDDVVAKINAEARGWR